MKSWSSLEEENEWINAQKRKFNETKRAYSKEYFRKKLADPIAHEKIKQYYREYNAKPENTERRKKIRQEWSKRKGITISMYVLARTYHITMKELQKFFKDGCYVCGINDQCVLNIHGMNGSHEKNDLRCLCCNCHYSIHRGKKELKDVIKEFIS